MSISPSKSTAFKLKFESGTLVLENVAQGEAAALKAFVWDERIRQFRAPAFKYREIIKEFVRSKINYVDEAKKYEIFDFKQKFRIEPRPFQTESIERWKQ